MLAQSITERAAAVLGNLSASEQFTGAIRECGGIPRLGKLLDWGAGAKVREIAAKSLANMAGSEHNRKSIQLAGGRPALVHLLLQGPSSEVCCLGLRCVWGGVQMGPVTRGDGCGVSVSADVV